MRAVLEGPETVVLDVSEPVLANQLLQLPLGGLSVLRVRQGYARLAGYRPLPRRIVQLGPNTTYPLFSAQS
jgi:hypothetical protein